MKFDGEAELVIAVGTEGEVGILPSHAPFLTALRPGVLRANVRDGGGDDTPPRARLQRRLPAGAPRQGDDPRRRRARSATKIDIAQARADLAAAQEEQKAAGGDLAAWRRAQAKIDFANARLHVAGVD